MIHHLGGTVRLGEKEEYECGEVEVDDSSELFHSLLKFIKCWMTHGDLVDKIPPNFRGVAKTQNCPYAVLEDT